MLGERGRRSGYFAGIGGRGGTGDGSVEIEVTRAFALDPSTRLVKYLILD